MYDSIITPEYASSVWNPYYQKDTNEILQPMISTLTIGLCLSINAKIQI